MNDSHSSPLRIRTHDLRRSLRYNLLAWIPGAFWSIATAGVVVVELGKYLGADDFAFALLNAAPLVAVLFQLPGSLMIDALGKRKNFFICSGTIHRALYILIGLLPWIFPRGSHWAVVLMVLLTFIAMSLGNFSAQAWVNWMADLVPSRVRGKYFGLRSRIGIAVVALTGIAIAVVLDVARQPWFESAMDPITRLSGLPPLIFLVSVIFILGGVIGMLDPLAFFKVDEPPMKILPREPLFSRLLKPLADRPFLRYIAYWSLWNVAVWWCGWLWWLNILDLFARMETANTHPWWGSHAYLAATIILTITFQLGLFVSYPIWGRAVDRFGRKPVFFISSTCHTLCWVAWVFLSPTLLPWYLLTQFLGGVASGGQDIASFNMMLQFNRRGGSGYQAVGSIVCNLAGALGAVSAGKLAKYLVSIHWSWTFAPDTPWQHTFNHYALLIALGVVIKYTADFCLLPLVHDPGEKPTAHAFRFVFDNTYGTLNTLIFNPLRTGLDLTGKSLSDARIGLRRWWR